jgi:hypothetical protein
VQTEHLVTQYSRQMKSTCLKCLKSKDFLLEGRELLLLPSSVWLVGNGSWRLRWSEEAGKGVLGVGLGMGEDVDAEKKEVEPGSELGLDEYADAEEETYPKGET